MLPSAKDLPLFLQEAYPNYVFTQLSLITMPTDPPATKFSGRMTTPTGYREFEVTFAPDEPMTPAFIQGIIGALKDDTPLVS